MKLKRILSNILVLATLAGLLVLPTTAASGSGFSDIGDPNVAEAAEILRLLGVVDGTGGGYFNPGGTLTRAEFCKMAVDVMDKGSLEPAQRNRTIFLDVGPRHWARGYVNLASSLTTTGEVSGATSGSDSESGTTSDRLILGVGNGNFQPDRPITYGEATAILTRILGYNTKDIFTGSAWYDGYIAIAKQNGLADGLTLTGGATITRGQAATLFRNLLFADVKGSEVCYLVAKLGGTLSDDMVLLSIDTSSTSGTNTVTVASDSSTSTPKTKRSAVSSALLGARGEMAQDRDGNFLTLRLNSADSIRRVSVSGKVDGNYITATGDEKIAIDPTTTVWKNGKATTFEQAFTDIYTGTPMVLCYGAGGKLDYVYLSSASTASENVMVARTKPNGTTNPFASLAGGDKNYQIYKNGVPATVADLRQYDVATYDSGARILYVSDLRLTGLYENAYPNPTAPSRLTMLSNEFTVLPGAISDLAPFKPGDTVTLLLTSDGRVAGALSTTIARSTAIGVVEECSADTAKVRPLMDIFNSKGERIVFSGDPNLSATSADKMVGQLVTVSSHKAGQISLSKLTSSGSTGTLNVASRTLDGIQLADNIHMFERVGTSEPQQITFSQLTRTTVPTAKILYVGKDYAGKINLLVFDDVTGDQYSYGFAAYQAAENIPGDSMAYDNPHIGVKNGADTTGSNKLVCGNSFRTGEAIGITASLNKLDGSAKLAGSVSLQSISGIGRTAYDSTEHTLIADGMVLPVSEQVWCYNKTTGFWFESGLDGFDAARAYSDDMTIYYDKAPEQGGKVRLVVVS